jgi:hypothetical protein
VNATIYLCAAILIGFREYLALKELSGSARDCSYVGVQWTLHGGTRVCAF